jgi:hypothetical protein
MRSAPLQHAGLKLTTSIPKSTNWSNIQHWTCFLESWRSVCGGCGRLANCDLVVGRLRTDIESENSLYDIQPEALHEKELSGIWECGLFAAPSWLLIATSSSKKKIKLEVPHIAPTTTQTTRNAWIHEAPPGTQRSPLRYMAWRCSSGGEIHSDGIGQSGLK